KENDDCGGFGAKNCGKSEKYVESSLEFANWLIELGNSAHSRTAEQSLVYHVFGNPENLLHSETGEQISNRAILCPKNDDCLKINNYIIRQMPGHRRRYASMNSIDSEDPEEIANFPTEFLDTLKAKRGKGFLRFDSLGMFFTFAKVEKIVLNHFLSEKAYTRDSFHQVIHDVACDGLVLPNICCDKHRTEMVPFFMFEYI
ncbi:ATP-dependent Helicase-like protein, partial [Daphnia magna]